MSIQWKEYDPYHGITATYISDDESDEIRVHREQDVKPLLDTTLETRNTKSADKPLGDLHLYCSIPMVVCHELMQKGINVFNPEHMPQVLAEINSNYQYLKYTDKTHALGSKTRPGSQTKDDSKPRGPLVIVR